MKTTKTARTKSTTKRTTQARDQQVKEMVRPFAKECINQVLDMLREDPALAQSLGIGTPQRDKGGIR